MKAYSLFHNYSLSNQLAAMAECVERGIEPGPINTFPGWLSLNRQVRRGEKAIELCMPLTRTAKMKVASASASSHHSSGSAAGL
jgi:hypothetical protein